MIRKIFRFIIGFFIAMIILGVTSDIASGDTSNTPFLGLFILLAILAGIYRAIGPWDQKAVTAQSQDNTNRICNGYSCPKCSSCTDEYQEEELLSRQYRYVLASGLKDKSKNPNPLVSAYRLTVECPNPKCKEIYTVDKIEEKEM